MTDQRLDALLLFPPLCQTLEAPPVGLSYLAGHARARGYSTEIVDLNLDVSTSLLSDEQFLTERVERSKQRLAALHSQLFLSGEEIASYKRLLRLVAVFSVDPARLRSLPDGFAERLRRSNEYAFTLGFRNVFHGPTVRGGFSGSFSELLSLVYRLDVETALPPDQLPPEDDDPQGSARYLAQRVESIRAGDHSTRFQEWVRDRLIPHVRSRAPTLVGISTGNLLQLSFGILLAAQLKQALPELPIVFGGNQTLYAYDFLSLMPWLGTLAEAWVFGEGENALLGCIDAARNGEPDWSSIPGVGVHRDGRLARPAALGQGPRHVVPAYPLVSLETPPARYTSTRRDVLTSRGCYWGRCKFCTHGLVYGRDYRPSATEDTLAMLRELVERDGARRFYFVDEALAPRTARVLSRALVEARLEIEWACYLRFEPAFADPQLLAAMKEAGCRLVEVGLESANQRVLDAMDKGITIETARKVLDALLDAGLQVHVFVMVGFPTETDPEAHETVELVREYSARGVAFLFSPFELTQHSQALAEHDALGIELLGDGVREPTFTVLGEGRHYRLTRGIDGRRAREIIDEMDAVLSGTGSGESELHDGSVLQRNAFAGASPAWFPLHPLAPDPPLGIVAREEGPYYFEVAGEGGLLVPEAAYALARALSSPNTLGFAIDRVCSDLGLNPLAHGAALRDLARELVAARILHLAGEG